MAWSIAALRHLAGRHDDLERGLDLRLDPLGWGHLHPRDEGLWWVVPIGRSAADEIIGTALTPWGSLTGGPLVCAVGGTGATWASSSRWALRAAATRRALELGGPQALDPLLGLADVLDALDRAMGGEGGGADAVRDLVSSFPSPPGGADAWQQREAWTGAALRLVEPTDAHRRARELVDAALAGRIPPGAEGADFGAWAGLARGAAWAALAWEAHDPARVAAAAWSLLRWPAGLDIGGIGPASHVVDAVGDFSTRLFDAAQWLVEQGHGDPGVWAETLQALAEEREDFQGDAFLQLAGRLAEGGDAVGAWSSILSAAHFAACHGGAALRPPFDAAVDLCATAGWADAEAHLRGLDDP
ncbi:MAG: hypothetical protein H6741_00090 [Alphaproteobacteria bacterium]|nr:hypothetical protein [Alphaproteobacteria bacterium]MCB9791103.1 hypothetical protein [Alphaproteobacteria bacterium]